MFTRLLDPFETLSDLQHTLNDLSGRDWSTSLTSSRGTYPPMNVFKRDNDYIALFEIPGVHKDQLDLQVLENKLRIKGTKNPLYGENVSVHRIERKTGSFDRTITLPVKIDPDKVRAEYQDGILAVFMPCQELEKPKSINIK